MVLYKETTRQLRSRADINVTDLLDVSNGSKYDVVYDTRELRFRRSGTDFPFIFGRERGWPARIRIAIARADVERAGDNYNYDLQSKNVNYRNLYTAHNGTVAIGAVARKYFGTKKY